MKNTRVNNQPTTTRGSMAYTRTRTSRIRSVCGNEEFYDTPEKLAEKYEDLAKIEQDYRTCQLYLNHREHYVRGIK